MHIQIKRSESNLCVYAVRMCVCIYLQYNCCDTIDISFDVYSVSFSIVFLRKKHLSVSSIFFIFKLINEVKKNYGHGEYLRWYEIVSRFLTLKKYFKVKATLNRILIYAWKCNRNLNVEVLKFDIGCLVFIKKKNVFQFKKLKTKNMFDVILQIQFAR